MADATDHDAADAAEAADSSGIGYAEALARLETILRELEGDAVDVDRLAEQVRRATTLIEFCRTRVEAARMEVTQVMTALDGPPGDGSDGATASDAPAAEPTAGD